jgi:hypothetical protein
VSASRLHTRAPPPGHSTCDTQLPARGARLGQGATLDRRAECCASGLLDACGDCDGPARAVDAQGACCPSAALDAGGFCCVRSPPWSARRLPTLCNPELLSPVRLCSSAIVNTGVSQALQHTCLAEQHMELEQ